MSIRRVLVVSSAFSVASQAERVFINATDDGRWRVMSEETGALGSDGTIRGAGGWFRLDRAKRYGADAMRTWDLAALPNAVPEAETLSLKISAGVWLTHDSHNYANCTDLDADPYWLQERARILSSVRRFKNSSAILWWTVGNEIELETDVVAGSECIWRRLEWVVKSVKAEDPGHPVGTVLAGGAQPKVISIRDLCPSLDFLGVNTYGDSSLRLGSDLKEANWTKPYAIMEFGPTGHWEAPLTSWGTYIEESSSEKVPRYNATCHSCREDNQCIGAFAFVWGWKWEKTGTWYGMFNEWEAVTTGVDVNCTGCESEVLATLEHCWTGSERSNPPPSIEAIAVDGETLSGLRFAVDRGSFVPLHVHARQAENHNLTALWVVTEEVVSNAVGGKWEATNPLLEGVWRGTTSDKQLGLDAVLNTTALPAGASSFRLYVFVREDPKECASRGGVCQPHEASASLPFQFCHSALAGEECYRHVRYAMEQGINKHPQTLPGVNTSSTFAEFQMMFHQKSMGMCDMPCGVDDWLDLDNVWCHTAQENEECYGHVRFAMTAGIQSSVSAHPGITNTSTFEDFQMAIFTDQKGLCTRPCPASADVASTSYTDGSDSADELSGSYRVLQSVFIGACFPLALAGGYFL